jgi:hypothetical protein
MAVKDGTMRSKFGEDQQGIKDRQAGAGKAAGRGPVSRPAPDARVKHGLY